MGWAAKQRDSKDTDNGTMGKEKKYEFMESNSRRYLKRGLNEQCLDPAHNL